MLQFLALTGDVLNHKCYALSDMEKMGVLPQLYKYYQETGCLVCFLRRKLGDPVNLETKKAVDGKAVELACQQYGMFAELVSMVVDLDDNDTTALYAVSVCQPCINLTCEAFLNTYMTFLQTVTDALYVFLGDLSNFCWDVGLDTFVKFLAKTFQTACLKETVMPIDVALVPTSCITVKCETHFLSICRQYMPYVRSVYVEAVKQGLTMDSIADSWWGCGRLGWLSTSGHATYMSKQNAEDKLWVLLNDATRYLAYNSIGVLSKYLKTYDLVLEVPIAE